MLNLGNTNCAPIFISGHSILLYQTQRKCRSATKIVNGEKFNSLNPYVLCWKASTNPLRFLDIWSEEIAWLSLLAELTAVLLFVLQKSYVCLALLHKIKLDTELSQIPNQQLFVTLTCPLHWLQVCSVYLSVIILRRGSEVVIADPNPVVYYTSDK